MGNQPSLEKFLRNVAELQHLTVPPAESVMIKFSSPNLCNYVINFICHWSNDERQKAWRGFSTNIEDYEPGDYRPLFLGQENLDRKLGPLIEECHYIILTSDGWIYPTYKFVEFINLLCASDNWN